MRIICLCPTYGRPQQLLENAVGCFLAQDYPATKRQMLILDDAGTVASQQGAGWQVVSSPQRFPSLAAKYARLLELAGNDWDSVAVWDDDDIYLPWHLSCHASALSASAWSHPREVWSNYTGDVVREEAAGRFHGALAIRRDLIEQLGGWVQSRRADFDQQQIAGCQRLAGEPGRPDAQFPPSYVFRWGNTEAAHAQWSMRSPGDESWYDKAQIVDPPPVGMLQPRLDADARAIVPRLHKLFQEAVGD